MLLTVFLFQVLGYVKAAHPAAAANGDDSSIALWEAQAVLLLWLSILVLIPFDLFILDSSVTDDASTAAAKRGYTPLAAKIMELCQEYLQHPGNQGPITWAVAAVQHKQSSPFQPWPL